jgi:integrase
MNMENLRSSFLQARGDLAKDTLDSYHHSLQAFVDFSSDRIQSVEEITTDTIEKYTAYLGKHKGCSGTSIQQYVTILKLMLRWADHPVEYTYRLPSKERKQVKLKRMNRWFTEQDVSRCFSYRFPIHHDRNHLAVRLMVETGARVREIAQVTSKDVDRDKCMVWLRESKTEPRAVFYSTETGKVFDQVIRSRQVHMWNRYIKLFPSVGHIKKIINDMLKDLGLKNGKDGRGPHTFRHYCATYLHYVGGMSISDIGFLLGDTPGMIRDRYLHPTPEMLKGRMDKVWNGG